MKENINSRSDKILEQEILVMVAKIDNLVQD